MCLSEEYRDFFIRNLQDTLSGQTSSSVAEAVKYSEKSRTKSIRITIETRPDYCQRKYISDMLSYGCTRLEIGYNCTKALTPKNSIAPIGNGPYGQQTDLGWSIVSVAETAWEDMDSDNVGITHHIVVKDPARDLILIRNVGLEFINSLGGVLCHFCKEPRAFVCDSEKMFLQFKVDVHQNYLRFLRWENGDMDSEIHTYRMTRHLFGTTSSPGSANFALRKIATEGEADFGMVSGNRNDRHLRCTSPLYRLDPFLDEHYLLCVRDVSAKI